MFMLEYVMQEGAWELYTALRPQWNDLWWNGPCVYSSGDVWSGIFSIHVQAKAFAVLKTIELKHMHTNMQYTHTYRYILHTHTHTQTRDRKSVV